jgi:hypothetical protein
MFEPGPELSDGGDDVLGAGTIGDVGGGEVEHKLPAICSDGDVAFASHHLLAGVETTFFSGRRLD